MTQKSFKEFRKQDELAEAKQPKWEVTFKSSHETVQVVAPSTSVANKKAVKQAKAASGVGEPVSKTIKKISEEEVQLDESKSKSFNELKKFLTYMDEALNIIDSSRLEKAIKSDLGREGLEDLKSARKHFSAAYDEAEELFISLDQG